MEISGFNDTLTGDMLETFVKKKKKNVGMNPVK